ncbi:PAS domain S-box protein [Candidatus Latescibacterota bacterium]
MSKPIVLIVEDEYFTAKSIEIDLLGHDYIVPAISVTGKDAIKQAKKHMPDLILMDIKLKGNMDGIEAAEKIRELYDIPIIYLTAHDEPVYLEKAKITYPFGYLMKPVKENQLLITIEITLYKHNLEKEKEELLIKLNESNEQLLEEISERKKTEQALRESEVRYRTLFETAPEFIHILDNNGVIMQVNADVTLRSGYTEDDMIGRNITDFLTPASREIFEREFTSLFENEINFIEVEFACNDNTIINMDSACRVVYNDRDEIEYIVMIQRDITERKRGEESLRFHNNVLKIMSYAAEKIMRLSPWEQNIQEVLEQLGTAMKVSRVYIFENHKDKEEKLLTSQRYEWTASGIKSEINNLEIQKFPYYDAGFSRWVEILGEEIIFGHVRDFPLSEQEVLSAQGIYSIIVVPIYVEDVWWGFIGFDMCTAEHDWSTAEMDTLKTVADILGAAIHLDKAKEALQDKEKRFRELAELLPQSIFEFDTQGNFTYSNRHGFESTGYTQEDLEDGVNALQMFVPEDRERVQENIEKVLRGEQFKGHEYTLLRKDGSTYTGLIYSNAIIRDNIPVGIRGIVLDKRDQ